MLVNTKSFRYFNFINKRASYHFKNWIMDHLPHNIVEHKIIDIDGGNGEFVNQLSLSFDCGFDNLHVKYRDEKVARAMQTIYENDIDELFELFKEKGYVGDCPLTPLTQKSTPWFKKIKKERPEEAKKLFEEAKSEIDRLKKIKTKLLENEEEWDDIDNLFVVQTSKDEKITSINTSGFKNEENFKRLVKGYKSPTIVDEYDLNDYDFVFFNTIGPKYKAILTADDIKMLNNLKGKFLMIKELYHDDIEECEKNGWNYELCVCDGKGSQPKGNFLLIWNYQIESIEEVLKYFEKNN